MSSPKRTSLFNFLNCRFFCHCSCRQQDAQEFLRYLINGLHEELNKAKSRPKRNLIEPKSSQEAWNQYRERIDDSKLIELFVGQFSSVIKCTICGNESTCWDPFWDLSLAVPLHRYLTFESLCTTTAILVSITGVKLTSMNVWYRSRNKRLLMATKSR